jgi:hypothetical protein
MLIKSPSQDNSDAQYRGFRSNLPALSALVAVFFVGKSVYQQAYLRMKPPKGDNLYLAPFYAGAAIVILMILHGSSALKVLVILLANFALCKSLAGKTGFVPALWAFNGLVLFANDRQHGYTFMQLHDSLAFLVRIFTVNPIDHQLKELRMSGRVLIHVGMLASTLPCFVSFPSAWTTTGRIPSMMRWLRSVFVTTAFITSSDTSIM